MAQGRSTKIISMNKWIRTSRLSIKNSLSLHTPGKLHTFTVGMEGSPDVTAARAMVIVRVRARVRGGECQSGREGERERQRVRESESESRS